MDVIWSVFELLGELRDIQQEAGVRGPVLNGPRALDVDILLYGSLVVDLPHLTVPHPRMSEREFVLRPLAEIAPGVVHPVVQEDCGGVAWGDQINHRE